MKIKKVLIYFSSFLALSLMFTVCYYLSYKNALKQFNEKAVERNEELMLALEQNGYVLRGALENNKVDEIISNNAEESINSNNVEVANSPDRLGEESIFIVRNYDLKHNFVTEEVTSPPEYLVGLNREQIIESFHDYMEELPWDEYAKGLTSYELVSLSNNKIVAQKTYNNELVEFVYIITKKENQVIVYYADGKTVFHDPKIWVTDLSEAEQRQLDEGIQVKTEEEIWTILEGFTT